MGRTLHLAVALIMIAMVTACSSSGDKWSSDESMNNESSASNSGWQKDSESSDATKKSSSSYWKEEGRY